MKGQHAHHVLLADECLLLGSFPVLESSPRWGMDFYSKDGIYTFQSELVTFARSVNPPTPLDFWAGLCVSPPLGKPRGLHILCPSQGSVG